MVVVFGYRNKWGEIILVYANEIVYDFVMLALDLQ